MEAWGLPPMGASRSFDFRPCPGSPAICQLQLRFSCQGLVPMETCDSLSACLSLQFQEEQFAL